MIITNTQCVGSAAFLLINSVQDSTFMSILSLEEMVMLLTLKVVFVGLYRVNRSISL